MGFFLHYLNHSICQLTISRKVWTRALSNKEMYASEGVYKPIGKIQVSWQQYLNLFRTEIPLYKIMQCNRKHTCVQTHTLSKIHPTERQCHSKPSMNSTNIIHSEKQTAHRLMEAAHGTSWISFSHAQSLLNGQATHLRCCSPGFAWDPEIAVTWAGRLRSLNWHLQVFYEIHGYFIKACFVCFLWRLLVLTSRSKDISLSVMSSPLTTSI